MIGTAPGVVAWGEGVAGERRPLPAPGVFPQQVLDGLARARRDGKLRLAAEDEGRAAARRTDALHRASWIVYAKRPFGGRTPKRRANTDAEVNATATTSNAKTG